MGTKKQATGRWKDYTEQDKQDTETRKRAKETEKRRAANAARPAKPRKAKQPRLIPLPVERVTGSKRAQPHAEPKGKPSTEEQKILSFKIDNELKNRHERQGYLAENDLVEVLKSVGGYYAFPIFEKPTDVSEEVAIARQTKLASADAKEAEEEYRISQLRMPDWRALFNGASGEYARALIERIIELMQKDAERDHKRRRKAFDVATQKPVRKVKASDDPMVHTREQISFLRWLLTTEQPVRVVYKGCKPIQTQKKIARQAIEEEIARLEGLVNPKAKRNA
jgi:hypothetical protein